jgi:predicted LPLAT superfamily acyltransferase
MFCLQEGNRTRLIIESPIRIESDGDRERSMNRRVLQYVSLLESYCKRYPEQYRNWHSREETNETVI